MKAVAAWRNKPSAGCGDPPARYYTPGKLAEVFDGRQAGPYEIDGPALARHMVRTEETHRIGPWTFRMMEGIKPEKIRGLNILELGT